MKRHATNAYNYIIPCHYAAQWSFLAEIYLSNLVTPGALAHLAPVLGATYHDIVLEVS